MFKTFQERVQYMAQYIQATLLRINAIKHNGHTAMSFISNVYKGNAVKEHVGFVVL